MDFKQRFAGKMEQISKCGAIDEMVQSSRKPIKSVDKITIKSLRTQST